MSTAKTPTRAEPKSVHPYQVDPSLATRWITFENPNGASGMGGRASSRLGVGRKGAPSRILEPGETVQLCDVEGPGTIRHFWCATEPNPLVLRGLVLRAWFDDQETPNIECPLGDFMGLAHGKVLPYCSAVHSIGDKGALNFWLPMPFTQRARITITNDGDHATPFLFQLACTLGDRHVKNVGRLHCLFRRENPTVMGLDFELLPLRNGHGRFIGSVIGVRSMNDAWWGEGEVKIFLDGDLEFPTLCGTGSEDYVGLGFDPRPTPFLYHGCNLHQKPFTSIYRWHLLDPILWKKDVRITIQQIGCEDGKLIETADDWSVASFWYEPTPSARLPPLPDFETRTRDLPG